MRSSLVSAELFDALERSSEGGATLIVTPTALSASTLRARYNDLRRADNNAEAGSHAWAPARVLSWTQWLGSLWSSLVLHGHETRTLLNSAQEDLLWREVVTASLPNANLATAPAVAALARSGYALASSYGIPVSRLASEAESEDTRVFASWATGFQRLCARHNCLPAPALPAELLKHLGMGHLELPSQLHLCGFLELFPADSQLLDRIRFSGTRAIDYLPDPAPAVPGTSSLLRACDETEELRAIAHWLRSFLEAHVGAGELPEVAVVVTNANLERNALERIFREILAPELNDVGADPSSAPWRVSAGEPLGDVPLIATLVRLLGAVADPLEPDELTALLLSPYLRAQPAQESGAHAGLEAAVQTAAQFDAYTVRQSDLLRPELSLPDLHRLAQSSPYGRSTITWLRPVLAFVEKEGALGKRRTHADWVGVIRELANAAGWPGPRSLAPHEFAASRAWDHVLDQVATLDFTGKRVSFVEARSAVLQQLASTSISLPTRPLIQVLSAAEAAAVAYDAVVLAGGSETFWPPPERPHPLLPRRLQTALGMPGAGVAFASERAGRLTNAILKPAAHLLVTYAAEAGDVPQRLAPVLAERSREQGWSELRPVGLIAEAEPRVLAQSLADTNPLPPLPAPYVPGGANVLRLQAACGFRAFAEIRLQSKEPGERQAGFDARQSGNVLHRALDAFWTVVRSQRKLNAMTRAEQESTVRDAVENAFARRNDATNVWDVAYISLQKKRLENILRGWLQVERSRRPFEVIRSEQNVRLGVGPLELSLRVDREDRVTTADGGDGTLLVDYKTGAHVHPGSWDTERPDEPQLPLYSLLPELSNLQALAFAKVRPGDFRWAGIQGEEDLLPKAKVVDFEQQLASWRTVLVKLAENFADGDCSVRPKSYPGTCAFCQQRFLCRVEPAELARDEGDDAAEYEEFAGDPLHG